MPKLFMKISGTPKFIGWYSKKILITNDQFLIDLDKFQLLFRKESVEIGHFELSLDGNKITSIKTSKKTSLDAEVLLLDGVWAF